MWGVSHHSFVFSLCPPSLPLSSSLPLFFSQLTFFFASSLSLSLSPFLPPSLLPKDHPTLAEGLDLVQEDDQITHLLSLGDDYDGEDILNVFQEDNDYLANEEKYKEIKAGESTLLAFTFNFM